MFGPRLDGRNGVALLPSTLEHFKLHPVWETQPEVGRFWGPRFGELTQEHKEEHFKKVGADQTQIQWTIAYRDEPVGFTGIFGIETFIQAPGVDLSPSRSLNRASGPLAPFKPEGLVQSFKLKGFGASPGLSPFTRAGRKFHQMNSACCPQN